MKQTNLISKNAIRKSKSKNKDQHACHKHELKKFKRIKGQIEGVEKMIENGRYCPEILTQIKAVRAGLLSIEGSILKSHLSHCVSEAMSKGKASEREDKIDEIVELFKQSTLKNVRF